MKLTEFKTLIQNSPFLTFQLPNGSYIPAHFHVTEVGLVSKQFIDCGGTPRTTKAIHLQIWLAQDIWHRLTGEKLLKIIEQVEQKIGLADEEVYVEFQNETIGIYGLEFTNNQFNLKAIQTACLAEDHCGISIPKINVKLSELGKVKSCCSPDQGCC